MREDSWFTSVSNVAGLLFVLAPASAACILVVYGQKFETSWVNQIFLEDIPKPRASLGEYGRAFLLWLLLSPMTLILVVTKGSENTGNTIGSLICSVIFGPLSGIYMALSWLKNQSWTIWKDDAQELLELLALILFPIATVIYANFFGLPLLSFLWPN